MTMQMQSKPYRPICQKSRRSRLLERNLVCDDWFTARVSTCGEFDQALKTASEGGRGAYIEVVTDKYAALPVGLKFHENVKTLYRT